MKGRRESAVGSFGDGCRGAQRALRHEGLGGKARHTGTDALYAVQLRFPSEDPMNIREGGKAEKQTRQSCEDDCLVYEL